MYQPNPDDRTALSETEHDRFGDPWGIAVCRDLKRHEGRTVIYHEDHEREWLQSDLALDRVEMR
jgi:hypothetical protein